MNIKHWIQAARPFSNTNLIFPLLLGQGLAYHIHGKFSWLTCILILLYGWFDQMYIVFINDAVDSKGDKLNNSPTPFSGGSRVVPEGKLTPQKLFTAGIINSILVLSVGLFLTLMNSSIYLLPLFMIGLLLLWMYSLPPFRMNYRGGGEILQGLGCGILLPLIGFYSQTNSFDNFSWIFVVGLFIIHTASSIATTLGDYDADKMVGKNTIAVKHGVKPAALRCLIFVIVGLSISFIAIPPTNMLNIFIAYGLPCLILFFNFNALNRIEEHQSIIKFDTGIILITILFAIGYIIYLF